MALSWLIAVLLAVPGGFMEAPAYVRLFTPRGVPSGTYRTYTTPRDLDGVVAMLRQDPAFVVPPTAATPPQQAFAIESSVASDAFGQSGGYNRWKLAILYGGRRVRVARGPRLERGHVVEAWTLLSPYPDADLERLNTGTLLIVLKLAD